MKKRATLRKTPFSRMSLSTPSIRVNPFQYRFGISFIINKPGYPALPGTSKDILQWPLDFLLDKLIDPEAGPEGGIKNTNVFSEGWSAAK